MEFPSYFCQECEGLHSYDSNMGRSHLEFASKEYRRDAMWEKRATEEAINTPAGLIACDILAHALTTDNIPNVWDTNEARQKISTLITEIRRNAK